MFKAKFMYFLWFFLLNFKTWIRNVLLSGCSIYQVFQFSCSPNLEYLILLEFFNFFQYRRLIKTLKFPWILMSTLTSQLASDDCQSVSRGLKKIQWKITTRGNLGKIFHWIFQEFSSYREISSQIFNCLRAFVLWCQQFIIASFLYTKQKLKTFLSKVGEKIDAFVYSGIF